MNKSNLVEVLDKKNNIISKNDIEVSLNKIIDYISSSLSKGDRIEIRGFGSFSIRKRGARIARNPKTGKSISVQSKFHPYFRASKALKESLNK